RGPSWWTCAVPFVRAEGDAPAILPHPDAVRSARRCWVSHTGTSLQVLASPLAQRLDEGAERPSVRGQAVVPASKYHVESGVALTCAALTWGSPALTPTVVASALFVVGIAMSVGLLVPINNRVASWTVQDAPDDWRDQLRRWDRIHTVRTGVILLAFVLLAVAAVR